MKETYRSFNPDDLEVGTRQKMLACAVAPRPIAFASTIDKQGKVNLSPFSYFNVFSANPPVVVFSTVRRGRDGTTKHTYENIQEVREVCVNIVNYPMVEQMSLASAEYDKGTNEFKKAGFTSIASETIKPPRVAESPVSFECDVDQVIDLGDEGGAGSLIIARIKFIHIREEFLDDEGNIDNEKLDLVGRNGGSWYTRASGDALFQIPKPLRSLGIGVDRLPVHVQQSSILTGNNLGRLGNLKELPSDDEIHTLRSSEDINRLFESYSGDTLTLKVHEAARDLIEAGEPQQALTLLLTLNDD